MMNDQLTPGKFLRVPLNPEHFNKLNQMAFAANNSLHRFAQSLMEQAIDAAFPEFEKAEDDMDPETLDMTKSLFSTAIKEASRG